MNFAEEANCFYMVIPAFPFILIVLRPFMDTEAIYFIIKNRE